ncbi:CDP-glycerol glycerophosphotransferase family protein [Clostridium botulinum]|uniref:Uncharacterized protein n=1 Tax=Clostridium botulinum TaxID=1491 RepID=A0A6B4QQY5_CLOBO|nr:CDP-glycerol glycerophosphotransferase family protein [Clostridium botulinum]EES50582.1 Bcs3 [Clostridium botulinum E1 str. 'BoNT E Beluga']MBN1043378.1 hypothetical protein [Clostridium botulinum]MBN1078885.1 hypothetical protein [Clostridium botulinum]MBY6759487.1 CDP-glycerol glycerophosphotransferase family protein [Clostridium botulinum]MBY6914991.1 CDP-glycerol glycerophosphotransferase family protein [Clostridium botulinum]
MSNITHNIRNDKIWVFNSGNIFNGNPKWLFIYINKYRKDIKAYWLCDSKETVKFIRKLGYKAYTYKSKRSMRIQKMTGVFVVNQVKESIPKRMSDVKILNLWHGVGCKSVERKVFFGFLGERIAKKYIKYNQIYKNNQLFLATSPLMEEHFKEQCGIDDDKIIRAGYPCCMYKDKVETFDHHILKNKGLSPDTKIAVYCPTYRDGCKENFFGKAIVDIDKLIHKLEEKNMLLIFKIHPLMENDYEYNNLKNHYYNCKNILFWNNNYDIYEIFNQIDLAIIDYSSIFYDMLAAGVPHFIRYIFDYEDKNNIRDFVFDYKEMTFGKICSNFDELINTFDDYEVQSVKEKKRISDLFWSYQNENSFEEIINKTLEFRPQSDRELPNLYSFDIFDTLIERKTLSPIGIFYYVQEKIQECNLKFSSYFKRNFVNIRRESERNVREYYKKTLDIREEDKLEISFDEIYEHMAEIYQLSKEQVDFMKKCELNIEYENCTPKYDMISYVKELLDKKQKVVLISDMYLPKEFIQKLLIKADSILGEIPLYLSSHYGVQKTTKKLYLKVYEDSNYNYKEWIHYGDNRLADGNMASKLNIKTNIHSISEFNGYENSLVNKIQTYDSYLVSALMARFRTENNNDAIECYSYSYVTLYWIPYVSWVIKDALKKGIKSLYFISRDGYHLKRVADTIIDIKKLDLKTKYIYGSRKAWRIPSFINKIDDEFFGKFGNFTKVNSYENLLKAMDINEEKFEAIFPHLKFLKNSDLIDEKNRKYIISTINLSSKYKEYLLVQAKKERAIVNRYLLQEINFEEKFAFVEYWGRGYTQDCLTRLIKDATGKNINNPFYYARSIYQTKGNSVRYNYTTNNSSLIFVEALFANLPYQSVEAYEIKNNKIVPVINKRENDSRLHEALKKNLVKFCNDFYKSDFINEDAIERELFRFSLSYYNRTQYDRYIVSNIAHLKDSVELYGKEAEFAPAITWKTIYNRIFKGENFKPTTKSITMSMSRTPKSIKRIYKFKKNILDKNKYFIKLRNKYSSLKRKFKI